MTRTIWVALFTGTLITAGPAAAQEAPGPSLTAGAAAGAVGSLAGQIVWVGYVGDEGVDTRSLVVLGALTTLGSATAAWLGSGREPKIDYYLAGAALGLVTGWALSSLTAGRLRCSDGSYGGCIAAFAVTFSVGQGLFTALFGQRGNHG